MALGILSCRRWQALGIGTTPLYSSDPKPAVAKLIELNIKAQRHFEDVAEVAAKTADGLAFVIFIAGFPCAPFSLMRAARGDRQLAGASAAAAVSLIVTGGCVHPYVPRCR